MIFRKNSCFAPSCIGYKMYSRSRFSGFHRLPDTKRILVGFPYVYGAFNAVCLYIKRVRLLCEVLRWF
jgi:hypothetical protein